MPVERALTHHAKDVIRVAEARPRVSVEHFLAALIREREGCAALVLANCGLTEYVIALRLVQLGLAPDEVPVVDTLDLVSGAFAEAHAFGHRAVGTEHLLLALLRPEQCELGDFLDELGIDREEVRGEALRMVTRGSMFLGKSEA